MFNQLIIQIEYHIHASHVYGNGYDITITHSSWCYVLSKLFLTRIKINKLHLKLFIFFEFIRNFNGRTKEKEREKKTRKTETFKFNLLEVSNKKFLTTQPDFPQPHSVRCFTFFHSKAHTHKHIHPLTPDFEHPNQTKPNQSERVELFRIWNFSIFFFFYSVTRTNSHTPIPITSV